jgi:glycine cleavage system H protein
MREYAEGHWCTLENKTLTVGLNEEVLNQIEFINNYHIAEIDEEVEASQIIGEIASAEDSISIYSPASGKIVDVNQDIVDNPDLIYQDPTGESWLFKLEVDDEEELDALFEEKVLVQTD